jgi:metal-responsive CopG/Arc/MetJ family transcriptional regulator
MDKESYDKLTITLPESLLKEFRKFCGKNGINLSSRIAILIKGDLKEKNPLKR